MRKVLRLIARAAGGALVVITLMLVGAHAGEDTVSHADRPDLAYLKEVNAWRPPEDSQLLFLLMSQYANSGRHLEGAAYIDGLRRRFDAKLDNTQRALYLTALASLRAGAANQVFVLRRIGWVRETLAMLDEATRLTNGNAFITHWMSGVVRAQLPGLLGEREQAKADLRWCLDHPDRMPHAGWLREVHYQMAEIERQRDNAQAAQNHLTASGYGSAPRPVSLVTPFTEDPVQGHSFAPRRVRELVPGSVYLVSGFEFTEYYFVVSADRRELMAIDAGTRTDAAREAYEALRTHLGGTLPPLTTVFITHAHWDHVGGHRFFRSLSPAPRFIGRSTYAAELQRTSGGDPRIARTFFGSRFSEEDVLAYKPDQTVEQQTSLTIGGTRVDLLPTRGGETDDAMMIHLPEQGVLFVGDIVMPYFGAPFVNEGSIDGMLAAIDQVAALKPRLLLHGHEPLTAVFGSTDTLTALNGHLSWLRDAVLRQIAMGAERGTIQQANLMPPNLSRSSSAVHMAYLVLRENMINRLYQQHNGYWLSNQAGMDILTDADRGSALVDYMGVTEGEVAGAVERMLGDGRYELAAQTLRWTQPRLRSERLAALRRTTYAKLMEQNQQYNPFKFIVYAAQAGQSLPPVNAKAP